MRETKREEKHSINNNFEAISEQGNYSSGNQSPYKSLTNMSDTLRSRLTSLKVPEFATKYYSTIQQHDWKGTLRSWEDFATAPQKADGEVQIPAFNIPNGEQLKPRIMRNFSYFVTNYILVYSILTVYGIISDTYNLFMAFALGGMWYFVVKTFPNLKAPTVNGTKITQKHLYILLICVSAIVGFVLLGEIFYMVLSLGTLFCLLHASLRVPSYHDNRKMKIGKTDEDNVADNIEDSNAV
eukprot:g5501.t1